MAMKISAHDARNMGIVVPKSKRGMNRWESEYSQHLATMKMVGEVREFWYESCKIRLANGCWYTPDFMVLMPSGEIEFHEVKGFFRDDAKVKLKVAADKYPVIFKVVRKRSKKDGGGWSIEVF